MADDNKQEPGDGGQPEGNQPDTTPPAGDKQDTPPADETTFTQAQVDQIVKERLARERQKYNDYDDLKTKAAKLAEIEEAQLSETEKLQKKLSALEEAKAKAESTAKNTLVRAAVISVAARLNFNDPEDAYRLIDRDEITWEEGEPQGVEKLVKALAEERKYLIKSKAGSLEPFEPSGDGGGVQETDAQKRQRIYGGGGMWDTDPAVHGGGVIWPKGLPGE